MNRDAWKGLASVTVLSLLAVFLLSTSGYAMQGAVYKRSLYRHWVDADHDCQDTRQEVLIRDSAPDKLKLSPNGCRVLRGEWYDPYTDVIFTDPRRLDVDHLIPLKNAHFSGAASWSKEKKRAYANHLDYYLHLIPVSASENRKKGARGPEGYMPPNEYFHCRYVEAWSAVKLAWGLSSTPSEREAVSGALKGCR